MAIKVNGTTVIDDSRNLTNVASIDAATATAITAAGVGGGGAQDFTASGAIAAGDLVGLNTDGTVSKLGKYQEAQTYVATGNSTSNIVETIAIGCNGSGTYLLVYNDVLNNSGYLTARAATYSGGTWTLGTAVTIDSGGAAALKSYAKVVWNSVKSVFVIYWKNAYSNWEPQLVACSVSGTTVTVGSIVKPNSTTAVFNINEPAWGDVIVEPSTGTVFVCWSNTSSAYVRYRGYTLGGTGNRTLTGGTTAAVDTDSSSTYANYMAWSYDTTASRIVICYHYSNSYGLHAISGTISGTTITFGTRVNAPYDVSPTHPHSIAGFHMFYNSTSDTHILFHDRGTDGPIIAKQFELNGSSVDWSNNQGTLVATAPSRIGKSFTYDSDKDRYYIVGRKISAARNPNSYVTTVKIVDLDTVAASTGIVVENEIDMANGMDENDLYVAATYDASDNIVAMFTAKNQYNASNAGLKGVVKGLNVHAPYETFVGIATEAISSSSTGSITTFGGINENVSGLSAGEVYQISPKTGTLEKQKGLSIVLPTSGTEPQNSQNDALDDRKPVGIAVSATKILLTPTR